MGVAPDSGCRAQPPLKGERMVTAAILLPSNGPVEVLPGRACPQDVLQAQGRLIRSDLSATCQLHWTTHSAYLLDKVNAFCSGLAGQLVRGDAVLVAEHSSQAAAEAWLKQTTLKHSTSNSLHQARGATEKPHQQLQGLTSLSETEAAQQSAHLLSDSSLSEGNRGGQAEVVAKGANLATPTREAEVLKEPRTTAAVPEDACEPRSSLLWRIVGQASSVTWTRPSVADPEEASSESISSCDSGSRAGGEICTPPPLDPRAAARPARLGLWEGLQPELLVKVAALVGSAAHVQAMLQTCRHWRQAVLADKDCLKRLKFSPPQSTAPFGRKLVEGVPCPSTGLPISCLADMAAKSGNLGACLAVAGLLERLGMPECMRYWRRAAQLGDPRAQVVYGTACYSGSHGIVRDGEEAYRWLVKARTRLAVLQPSPANGELLTRAALHLGFLALDGEVMKTDLETAVGWFRLASHHGCRDAQIALGTLLRTGQYGPS